MKFPDFFLFLHHLYSLYKLVILIKGDLIYKKDINIEYGKILKKYRKKNNLTQEDVSELSGLAPRYIC